MRLRSYILTGVAAYLVFLLTAVPASLVVNQFADSLPVKISNVSGTLWNGRAGSVDTGRDLILKNLHWSFLPWRLLLASAAVDMSAEVSIDGRP